MFDFQEKPNASTEKTDTAEKTDTESKTDDEQVDVVEVQVGLPIGLLGRRRVASSFPVNSVYLIFTSYLLYPHRHMHETSKITTMNQQILQYN